MGDAAVRGCDTIERTEPAPSSPSGGLCVATGWCWDDPRPHGNALSAVWTSGPSDVWAVGGGGTVVHWDGTQWSRLGVADAPDFTAVWGSSPTDVWLVGSAALTQDLVLHWDGTTLAPVMLPPRTMRRNAGHAVWGTASHDVWLAVGGLLHWDGVRWSDRSPPDVMASGIWFWGIGTDALVAEDNQLFRWDSARWQPMPTSPNGVGQLAGLSADDVWSLSGTLDAAHWDGVGWSPVAIDLTFTGSRFGIPWSGGRSDVWIALVGDDGPAPFAHWDGTTWSRHDGPDVPVAALAGSARDNVWAVGDRGTALHWDGTRWTSVGASTPLPAGRELRDLAGTSEHDLWAVGVAYAPSHSSVSGLIAHRDARGWSVQASVPTLLNGVWAGSERDVWAVGDGGALHWDGARWTAMELPGDPRLEDVWGSGPSDVWATGGGQVVQHWDGARWSSVALPDTAEGDGYATWAVAGSRADDVWVVGSAGSGLSTVAVVVHWNGLAWTAARVGGSISTLDGAPIAFALAVRGPSDVWLLGTRDGPMHWDGMRWSLVRPADVIVGGPGAAATSGPEVWASGNVARVAHWDGALWCDEATGADDVVQRLWASPEGGLWALTRGGGILHRAP